MKRELSALEKQAADALRRARRLPVGAARNDLRQLAMGLLWLHRNGMDALVRDRMLTTQSRRPSNDLAYSIWQLRLPLGVTLVVAHTVVTRRDGSVCAG